MDGVMHPSVEQAIGRDRIRNALKRYENNPADEHDRGIVRYVNADGSYEVLLDGDVQTARCSPYAKAMVGDRVIVVTTKDGENVLLGRLGGEIGGDTESIPPTIEERFEGIESEIDLLKTNKVLWSGVLGMVASQTATLSEAISEQPNGIMLVFSWYDTATSTAKDWSWHYHPIPKHHVLKHGGQGVNIGLVDLDGYHCAKYLYVSDTGIAGHANNWSSATVGGVDLYKSGHVLRYVIGY